MIITSAASAAVSSVIVRECNLLNYSTPKKSGQQQNLTTTTKSILVTSFLFVVVHAFGVEIVKSYYEKIF